jgi:hypothetical protein
MLVRVILLVLISFSFSYILAHITYGQSEEKSFTSPKFGLSMKYPVNWTFLPSSTEDFSPGIYDYSVIVPPGSAALGQFCPTSNLEGTPAEIECGKDSPTGLSLSVFKLKQGTTLKEFYDNEVDKSNSEVKRLVGPSELIETKKVNISGLSAIQTISVTTSGGVLGNALKIIGDEPPQRKDIFVYLVNGGLGYQILDGTKDEKDFDTYFPILQKMINSIQIEGAKENQVNPTLVPEAKTTPDAVDVVLLSHKLKRGSGGYNDVIGQVKNIGSDTVEFVKIGLTVYDKNGDVVGTDSSYADSATLKPNQKSSFDIISTKNNFNGMKNYELSLQWRDANGEDQYIDNAQDYKVNSIQ